METPFAEAPNVVRALGHILCESLMWGRGRIAAALGDSCGGGGGGVLL